MSALDGNAEIPDASPDIVDNLLEKQLLTSLNGQQRTCYQVLQQKDAGIAAMYLGALAVLRQNYNPDKISQSAHSLFFVS